MLSWGRKESSSLVAEARAHDFNLTKSVIQDADFMGFFVGTLLNVAGRSNGFAQGLTGAYHLHPACQLSCWLALPWQDRRSRCFSSDHAMCEILYQTFEAAM